MPKFEKNIFYSVISSIKTDLEAGLNLTAAFQKHPNYFDEIYCCFIQAGEQSGQLATLLMALIAHQEKILTIKTKTKRSLYYPVGILCSALLVAMGLIWIIIPQFQHTFKELKIPLPFATQLLIQLSQIKFKNFFYLFVILLSGMTWYRYRRKTHSKISYKVHRYSLKCPLIGRLIHLHAFSIWFKIVANTYHAAIPLIDSLTLANQSLNNFVLREILMSLNQRIHNGQSLFISLKNTGLFTLHILELINIGEKSGQLEQIFFQIADFYQTTLEHQLQKITSLLKPTIMLLLAIFIGFLILAMYLPILRMGAAL